MSARAVVRTLSELCITAGLLTVLFVVYVLYWTGVQAQDAGQGEIAHLQDRWAAGGQAAGGGGGGTDAGTDSGTGAGTDGAGSGASNSPYPQGKSFAVMYIPRLGGDWAKPVLENTRKPTLAKGLGHYTGTARLGDKGNFAVAGHRRTHGDPFKDFPRLRPGDAVVVRDGDTWFTYRINNRPYRTLPSDTGVLDKVPRPVDPGAAPFGGPGRYLTLTTCDPEWGSSHRLIAWAHLDSTRPVSQGEPEALNGD
ncbi:class E sortase [Streptomyces sp. ODS28]|uniref:class E sortase n=1 Tax=Streptomyces sp. ODS28 TaxID=3136688 RepID=UPI0031F0E54E